jgi:hypothetical protein
MADGYEIVVGGEDPLAGVDITQTTVTGQEPVRQFKSWQDRIDFWRINDPGKIPQIQFGRVLAAAGFFTMAAGAVLLLRSVFSGGSARYW